MLRRRLSCLDTRGRRVERYEIASREPGEDLDPVTPRMTEPDLPQRYPTVRRDDIDCTHLAAFDDRGTRHQEPL
jgi:hypothetical protein